MYLKNILTIGEKIKLNFQKSKTRNKMLTKLCHENLFNYKYFFKPLLIGKNNLN